jgi:hypothetical protein
MVVGAVIIPVPEGGLTMVIYPLPGSDGRVMTDCPTRTAGVSIITVPGFVPVGGMV